MVVLTGGRTIGSVGVGGGAVVCGGGVVTVSGAGVVVSGGGWLTVSGGGGVTVSRGGADDSGGGCTSVGLGSGVGSAGALLVGIGSGSSLVMLTAGSVILVGVGSGSGGRTLLITDWIGSIIGSNGFLGSGVGSGVGSGEGSAAGVVAGLSTGAVTFCAGTTVVVGSSAGFAVVDTGVSSAGEALLDAAVVFTTLSAEVDATGDSEATSLVAGADDTAVVESISVGTTGITSVGLAVGKMIPCGPRRIPLDSDGVSTGNGTSGTISDPVGRTTT
jgi:hypothetical protein